MQQADLAVAPGALLGRRHVDEPSAVLEEEDDAVKTWNYYDETDQQRISELLVGRRIVKAEVGEFKRPDLEKVWNEDASGRLTLDNGTQLYVVPNDGCGGCSNGHYALTSLAAFDNVITSVRLEAEDQSKDGGVWHVEPEYRYRIYVVADGYADEHVALQIDGSDGNGYYGTGYEIVVEVT